MDCSRFIALGIFILRWKRVCIAHNNCMSCPSIWATLSALLINILLGSFQLFLHSDQPLSEGGNNPFSSVCQSGGGCIIHAESVVKRTLTDELALMCNRRLQRQRPQSIIFGFSVSPAPSRCICMSAATSR